ncbi:hypothetical protein HaLaN_05121, partial [Haematococcus lacustris]
MEGGAAQNERPDSNMDKQMEKIADDIVKNFEQQMAQGEAG